MPTSDKNPWKTTGKRLVYENPWIRVVENDVVNPSGGRGIYGVVHFKRLAVGIIPVDGDGFTWLVGQYRYPTETYEWEIPEGGADPGETIEECARRELAEETGIAARSWDLILEGMQLSNSTTDERAFAFLARDLSFAEAAPEPTEELAVKRVPLAEAFAMVMRGEIRDGISVAALLKLKAMIADGATKL